MAVRILLGLMLALVASCKQNAGGSGVRSLSADPRAKNVAILIAAPGKPSDKDYLPGSEAAVKSLAALLERPDFGFEAVTLVNPTLDEIKRRSGEAAQTVGAEGTLYWHFDGHGSKNGEIWAGETRFDFKAVADAIKERRSTPLKRLIVTSDACFGGKLTQNPALELAGGGDPAFPPDVVVDAAAAAFFPDVVEDAGEPAGLRLLPGGKLYEQVVIAASTSPAETADGRGATGGYFHAGLEHALRTLEPRRETATIEEMLRTLKDWVKQQSGGKQTPSYRFSPVATGADLLFVKRAPPPGGTTPTPAPAPGTLPPVVAGTCPGAWGHEWAPGHGGTPPAACLQPESYCRCWKADDGNCTVQRPGAAAGAPPLLPAVKADAGGVCYTICDELAQANRATVVPACNGKIVVLNEARRLEAWTYVGTQPPPRPEPGPGTTPGPAPRPPVPGATPSPGQPTTPTPAPAPSTACTCAWFQEGGKSYCGFRKGGQWQGSYYGPFNGAPVNGVLGDWRCSVADSHFNDLCKRINPRPAGC